MKEMDCVEVIKEKDRYVKDGVHKGMQGWILSLIHIYLQDVVHLVDVAGEI